MPLGIEQNNHLLNLTLDVWQDQIFFDDSAFPAGYFAADILNVSDETMRELLTHGGEISFQVEALANAGCEEFIKLLPETRTSMEKVLDALWKCPPYSFLEKGKDFQALDVLFDPELVDELLKTESPIRQFFFRYLTAGFSIPRRSQRSCRFERSEPPDRLIFIPWSYGCRKDRTFENPCGSRIWFRKKYDSCRYVRIYGKTECLKNDRFSSGICRF